MTSTHLAICIRKFLVHFEFKVRINVIGRAKNLQKWLKTDQMMAIFSHKWLMLWRKKHIFINPSWQGGYGPILSSFEVLEVPILHRSSTFWPGLLKTPAPLELLGCTCICYKTGLLHQLTISSPSGTTCIGSKVGHQVESLSLPHCPGMLYWLNQLVSSWYLYQPESHQLSLQQPLSLTSRQM